MENLKYNNYMMKIFKKYISNMNDSNNLNDLTKKMEEMNKLMEANLFNNPLREINENFRKDLLEFREIFLNNLKTLEVTLVIIISFN